MWSTTTTESCSHRCGSALCPSQGGQLLARSPPREGYFCISSNTSLSNGQNCQSCCVFPGVHSKSRIECAGQALTIPHSCLVLTRIAVLLRCSVLAHWSVRTCFSWQLRVRSEVIKAKATQETRSQLTRLILIVMRTISSYRLAPSCSKKGQAKA
jgi:hypothetical protein